MTERRQILLQNALALLCEAQRRAHSLKDETSEDIKDLMHKVSHQAKEGAGQLLTYWNANKKNLPKKMTTEVDRVLNRFGVAEMITKKKAAPKKAPVKKAAPTKKTAPKKASAPRKAAPKKASPTPQQSVA